MQLDCETERTDGITLVTARLRNGRATDRQVRLRNCLDGPVLPPRRNGEPETGWDREGVTTVVPGGERVALGYACPAEPASPPVTVAWVDAVDGGESEDPVDDAMRRLADARPPRAVLNEGGESGNECEAETEPPSPVTDAASPGIDTAPEPPRERQRVPHDAETLLRPYRARLETVEALGAAGVPEAADLLASNGGLASIDALGTRLDDDAAALRALAAEATALAARAEAATPPTESLRRLS